MPVPWKFIPQVKPEDVESEEDQKEANRLMSMVDQKLSACVDMKFVAELTAQKQKLTVKLEFEQKFETVLAKTKILEHCR